MMSRSVMTVRTDDTVLTAARLRIVSAEGLASVVASLDTKTAKLSTAQTPQRTSPTMSVTMRRFSSRTCSGDVGPL